MINAFQRVLTLHEDTCWIALISDETNLAVIGFY